MTTHKRALGPLERIFPMPCVLIASGPLDNPGILTAAWINVVASTPPTIVIGLRETRNTLAHIQNTGCFSVNIPSTSLVAQVDYLGMKSGNTGENKLETVGLTVSAGAYNNVPLVNECLYNLECVVSDTNIVGSYHIVTAEIVQTYADESILIDEDSTVVSMEALDPLMYIAGNREYRAVGEKVADAYSIGVLSSERHK